MHNLLILILHPIVLCSWATLSETNNDYFTVEKTVDFNNYEKVGIQAGAGTSNIIKSYTMIDKEPHSGLSYYRLKQIDFNGNTEYSTLVAVNYSRSNSLNMEVYPNPVINSDININITGGKNEKVILMMNDLLGRQHYSKAVTLKEGVSSFMIENKNLIPGVYFIIVSGSNPDHLYKKIVIQ